MSYVDMNTRAVRFYWREGRGPFGPGLYQQPFPHRQAPPGSPIVNLIRIRTICHSRISSAGVALCTRCSPLPRSCTACDPTVRSRPIARPRRDPACPGRPVPRNGQPAALRRRRRATAGRSPTRGGGQPSPASPSRFPSHSGVCTQPAAPSGSPQSQRDVGAIAAAAGLKRRFADFKSAAAGSVGADVQRAMPWPSARLCSFGPPRGRTYNEPQ
jgi:hypothetical protein